MKSIFKFEVFLNFDLNNITGEQIGSLVNSWGEVYMEKFRECSGNFDLNDFVAMTELLPVLDNMLEKHIDEYEFPFYGAFAKFRITDNVIVFNISVK